MKYWIVFHFAIAVTIGLYSCHCSSGCANIAYQLTIDFFGFSDTEVTPIVLKSYSRGSNFTKFRDSIIYSNAANTIAGSDSYSNGYFINVQGNDSTDYMVNLPKAGLSYLITNMDFPLGNCRVGGCAKEFSVPQLGNYTLNGTLIPNNPAVPVVVIIK
jgi:hypothetical protein